MNLSVPPENEKNHVTIGFGRWFQGMANGKYAINALVLIAAMAFGTILVWKLLG
ncbi:hypothetical protein [Asticcacaulis sp.]|uniref:hypothetical protein n=1 Tax=Asticcacaulis sp. TaxID=1872648 RepID=UPI002CEB9166|nr:hypothetical protein [Asticcacaulis sp.]MCR6661421.1 hypothetical protein [Asticcacaulis sp.]HTM83013.1 hypothetical protein [Asticcacaulis sp.]